MKTRSVKWVIMAMALLSMAMPFTAKAQDKVEASVGVDLVSGYVWRGQDLGGVSLQPNASIAYKGFSLGAWGSVGIESSDTKEFDLILGYSTGSFCTDIARIHSAQFFEVLSVCGILERIDFVAAFYTELYFPLGQNNFLFRMGQFIQLVAQYYSLFPVCQLLD